MGIIMGGAALVRTMLGFMGRSHMAGMGRIFLVELIARMHGQYLFSLMEYVSLEAATPVEKTAGACHEQCD